MEKYDNPPVTFVKFDLTSEEYDNLKQMNDDERLSFLKTKIVDSNIPIDSTNLFKKYPLIDISETKTITFSV